MVYYYPLTEQLKTLMQLPEYRELLLYESRRSRSDAWISDVYDTPRWRKIAGAPTATLERIVLHYCVDGFPVYGRKEILSAKPLQTMILSLAPWLRSQSKHMLVQMLIPAGLKGVAAKKYYDWAANFEMNSLNRRGVDGVRVLIYGDTLDTPGRRELLNIQSVSAFYPCPHCLHTWQPGLRRQVHAGFRRFLPENSRWRQREFTFNGHRYMFRDVEVRAPPLTRTDETVGVMVSLATPGKPFYGHKGPRFFDKWIGTTIEASACDLMHDKKIFCEMCIKGLVGHSSNGMYKGWAKDNQHRADCKAYNIFPDFHNGTNIRPPWRLSKDAVKTVDRRVCRMWWPHYVDKLCRDNHSFWTRSDRMWKATHKHYALMVILPTCLHGFVPAVHTALLTIVDALRRLDGEVISIAEALRRGVEPGSFVIAKDPELCRMWGQQLIRGLILLEGSFPVAHINPGLHHMVHYAAQTVVLGLLRWLGMQAFERNNKRVKSLVRNTNQPLATLAHNLLLDIATRFISLSERPDSEFSERPPLCILLSRRPGLHTVTRRERFFLSVYGITSFACVRVWMAARIVNVHFRAGEWGSHRCGSVIVMMYGGRSRYCVVQKFLRVQRRSFAQVMWLSKPKYPYAPNRLVVRVRVLPPNVGRCIVAVEDIVPCRVGVIPDDDGVHYFMLREKGVDRVSR